MYLHAEYVIVVYILNGHLRHFSQYGLQLYEGPPPVGHAFTLHRNTG